MISAQREPLYESERLLTAIDYPVLTYFLRGDPLKPLIVFIPGAHHNGRIAYGGHQGSKPSDFLGHWLQRANYSFLAVSYPLESDPMVMPPTRADFTVRDWGAQAVDATKQTIEQEGLSNDVILLFWSMAGKILQPFALGANSRGLNVKLAISLAATPALRGLREALPRMTPTATGYADNSMFAEYFYAQLHEQNDINGGRHIISDETYLREYMGNTPVAMGAWGLRWSKEERKLVEDQDVGFEVAEETALGRLPFLGAIIGDSALDFRHSIADKATWGLYMTYQLMGVVGNSITATACESTSEQAAAVACLSAEQRALMAAREKVIWLRKNPEKLERIKKAIHDYPEKMCAVVRGNHHFFLGEKGAKQTTELILSLQTLVNEFQRDLSAVLAA